MRGLPVLGLFLLSESDSVPQGLKLIHSDTDAPRRTSTLHHLDPNPCKDDTWGILRLPAPPAVAIGGPGRITVFSYTLQMFVIELEHGHASSSPDDRWRNYFGC